MRIFVTGGTGFIGSHFLRLALAAGHSVRALRRPGSAPRIELGPQPEWLDGTLEQDWRPQLSGCEALVHLAAAGVNDRSPAWEDCFRWNVQASLGLWLQAAEAGVSRFVIGGSCFEYGRSGERYDFIPVDAPLEPTGPYAASKAAASVTALSLAADRKLSLTLLRPFHVFGEGEDPRRLWPSLRKAALTGADYSMTAGQQVRDFIGGDRVARVFVDALGESAAAGVPVIRNVGTGKPQTLGEFAGHWWAHWGARGRLLLGSLPYRPQEVMRYVPKL